MIRNNCILFGYIQNVEEWTPSLSVIPASIHFGEDGGVDNTTEVNVGSSSQVWDFTVSVSWITVLYASKIGDDDTIRVVCDAQDIGVQSPRTGYITFTSDDCADEVISIYQDARAG